MVSSCLLILLHLLILGYSGKGERLLLQCNLWNYKLCTLLTHDLAEFLGIYICEWKTGMMMYMAIL